jgi:hypothetical protein
MKSSYLLLASADLLLLGITAITGLLVSGAEGFARHFMLGVLSGLFTCFVHVVFFVYFIVQHKVFMQACLLGGLKRGHAERVSALKLRALGASMGGIVTILIVVALGAAIDVSGPPQVHMVAAFTAIAANGVVFLYQYTLLLRYGDVVGEAFPEG